jgi:hypothetical protein
MTGELNENSLLAHAAKAGCSVSADQLKRWRLAGLVQRPRQGHPSGIRGSQSWYPPEALEQLITVARLHQEMRLLSHLLVALWWDGRYVDMDALRAELVRWLDRLSAEAQALRDAHPDPHEAADELVRSAPLRNLSPLLSLMVRRLPHGRRDLREVLWLFGMVGFGLNYEPEPDNEHDGAPLLETLLAKAIGIDRAQRDRLFDGEPWLPPDVTALETVRELAGAGAFDLTDFARPVREACDADLQQARDDAHAFERLAVIGEGLQRVLGNDVAGIGSWTTMVARNPLGRAAMVRMMLVLRRVAGDDAVEQVRAVVDDSYPQFSALAAR